MCFLTLAAWLVRGAPVRADDGVYYSQQPGFHIPFHIDPGEQQVQSVILHVSTDDGKTYEQVATALPSQNGFKFQARKDGWHSFVVQTQDAARRLNPPDPHRVRAGLRVCVDTKPPQITLRAVQPIEGTVGVEWTITDDNPNLLTLGLEYHPLGSNQWLPLNIRPLVQGQYGWAPSGQGPFEVRLRITDKAGNTNVAKVQVTPIEGGTSAMPVSSGGVSRGKVIFMRNKAFQLSYKLENIGPSGCKVEVWMTTDSAKSWVKYSSDAPAEGPYQLSVRGPGRYGFTLRPVNGVGLAVDPPRPEEPPQIWVEVDMTPPVVNNVQVDVGAGQEAGKLSIRWHAKDEFLKPKPITISYGQTPTGPWKELAKELDNSGTWTGRSDKLPNESGRDEKLPYEFYVRVTAMDEANNVGHAQCPHIVKVDLQKPTVRSLEVKAVEVTPAPGGQAPGQPPTPPMGPGYTNPTGP